MLATRTREPDERVNWKGASPFIVANLVPLLVVFTGVNRIDVVLCVVLYVTRMFCITAGYHRYFAHRTYRLARVPQFLLAFGGVTAVQKGPLWWASNHRRHHRYADTPLDPHSPQNGFWWSHWTWIMSGKYGETDYEAIDDFARFPELRWLNTHDWVGPWMLGVACFLIDGWSGLVVGFFLSTVLLWHATFTVNSLSHVFGRRRYGTADTSRNNVVVALITGGEGWHNNHHHYPLSARQGFFWWEVDATYAVLRALSWVGIVHDLRQPPAAAKAARRVRRGHLDVGIFRLHINRAKAALPPDAGADSELLALLASAADRAGSVSRGKAAADRRPVST